MSLSKFLALDFGAESGRAIVGIIDEDKISLKEVHRFPNKQINVSGHLHWDLHYLFDEVKESLKQVVIKGHSDIQSIGIDTWGVDFGFVNKSGKITDLPFSYRDSRTNGMMEKVFEKIPREQIYESTGVQFMQINSLYQLYNMKLNEDKQLNKDNRLLFIPDLFNFLLTGEKKTEYTIASTSQFLKAEEKIFDTEIFETLGIPVEILPPIINPGDVIGKLRPEICAYTGLNRTDVVAVGSHDTASAIAAIPASGNDWAYLSSGTWSLLGIETDKPLITPLSLQNNFTNEGGTENKITFLRNVMGLWLLQQLKKSWEDPLSYYRYDKLTSMALEAKQFKCIIDPDDDSFLNPPDMEKAIRDFCIKNNLNIPETKGEFVRCVLESLALKYKDVIKKINEITGKEIKRLHIVGGGSQNEVLNQFTADACGIPVTAGPVEATALGNILIQAISKGKIESIEKGKKLISDSFPAKNYSPKDTEEWDKVDKGFNEDIIC